MLNTVKERLIYYLDSKGVNKSEFGRRIGVSNAFVTSIRKSIQPDKLLAIQNAFPDLNTSWLLTGEGEMLKSGQSVNGSNAKFKGRVFGADQKDDGVIMVDYIPVAAHASFIENIGTVSQGDFEQFPLIPMGNERNDIDSLRIFEVEGDSMYPTLTAGSLILAKEIPERSWHYAEGVVVAVYNEFVVVKRISSNRLLTDNCLILKSDNESYGEMTVPLSDLRGLYKAKRIISSEIF